MALSCLQKRVENKGVTTCGGNLYKYRGVMTGSILRWPRDKLAVKLEKRPSSGNAAKSTAVIRDALKLD